MRIRELTVLLLVVAAGCTSEGGREERGEVRTRHVSSSRPSTWTAAKVSYFSTQTGGLVREHASSVPLDSRFGIKNGASYFALVNEKWWHRDFHKAIEEKAYDISFTKGYAQQEDVTLDEPFELAYKPFVKVVENDILGKIIEGLDSKGFFEMPTVTNVAMSRGADGRPVLPPGHAWIMVQLDDWRYTVAFDSLPPREVQAFLDITSVVAGAFSAAPSPQATVVLDPVQVWDKRTLQMMGKEAARKPVDAEETDAKRGTGNYINAPKADPKWMEKKPQTTDDSLDQFLHGK